MHSWDKIAADLALVSQRQLFFIGGAPRSGTTWLQQMLDCHPDIRCGGEGQFQTTLAGPIATMMTQCRTILEAKNKNLFGHTGGYPVPQSIDADFLTATAILLALRRQCDGAIPVAIGEKTPENVFFFPYLQHLFPTAKFIGIARDPRDVLTSAWHFFHKPASGEDTHVAKTNFVQGAIPALRQGALAMIEFERKNPSQYMTVTYEGLQRDSASALSNLFRFLGVPATDETIADCIARTSFATMTGGRKAGMEQNGSFLRKGVVGDWRSTLAPEHNAMLISQFGSMLSYFGWHV